MRNKNILEKIIFCFKYKNIDEQQYEAMKRNLASKGISIRFIQTDEENAGIEELRKNVESRENILWICDYEIDRTSEDAVLIYQHERNTDLSFEGYPQVFVCERSWGKGFLKFQIALLCLSFPYRRPQA